MLIKAALSNEDAIFPLLSPQASSPRRPPSAHPPPTQCFSAGPTPLKVSTDEIRAAFVEHSASMRQSHHSPGIGGSEVESRDTGVW